jgi:hypothetical protein
MPTTYASIAGDIGIGGAQHGRGSQLTVSCPGFAQLAVHKIARFYGPPDVALSIITPAAWRSVEP